MCLRSLAGLFLLLGALLLVGTGAAAAQEPQRPFAKILADWNVTLERAVGELAEPDLPPARAEALRDGLAALQSQARKLKAAAATQIEPLRVQLQALGPAPAAGEQPELEEVGAQRRKIEEEIAFYQARIKQAELAIRRAEELAQQVAARSLRLSIQALLVRFPLPIAPETIAKAVPEFFVNLGILAASPVEWWQSLTPAQRERVILYRVLLITALALGLGWAIRRALLRWFGRDRASEHPSYTHRLTGAIAAGLADGVVPALILAGFMYYATSGSAVLSGLFAETFANLCGVLIIFVLAWALPRAVLAPDLPGWRLVAVSPRQARAISRRIAFLAGVFAVDLFFWLSTRTLPVSDELHSLYALVVSSLEAVAILFLIQGSLWAYTELPDVVEDTGLAPRPLGARFWAALQAIVALIAVAVIGTALAGYANLSRYLAESLVVSGMVVGALFLLRGLGRELVGMALRSKLVQVRLALPHSTRSRYKFWLRAGLDVAIYFGGLLLVLIVWGVSPKDLWAWTSRVLQGFTIGNVTISLTDIVAALAVFALAMVLTRILQRTLSERVLPQTGLDAGVRNSLSAGLGYVGLGIAVALAVAALGLDLGNIALIAGALSVGIGFGLQNVVNNFVSGLILLVERPIKVGDWILVGEHEGYVKRISVRATEIETFQRASVIVPNSELIAGAVINWTYKDSYGRVEVPVGVAYGSEIERVMEILQGCLESHPDILAYPKPYVLFRNFGDSSLDFEARGHIANVERRILVQSDLRVAISRALGEAGIEIPFPQRDLHIKGLDALVAAVEGKPALRPPAAVAEVKPGPRGLRAPSREDG